MRIQHVRCPHCEVEIGLFESAASADQLTCPACNGVYSRTRQLRAAAAKTARPAPAVPKCVVSCPGCVRRLRMPVNAPGKKLRCPACQTPFTLGANTGPDRSGRPQYMAIEIFEDDVVTEGFEIVVDDAAQARTPPKNRRMPTTPFRYVGEEKMHVDVQLDLAKLAAGEKLLPDEFGLIDDDNPGNGQAATSRPEEKAKRGSEVRPVEQKTSPSSLTPPAAATPPTPPIKGDAPRELRPDEFRVVSKSQPTPPAASPTKKPVVKPAVMPVVKSPTPPPPALAPAPPAPAPVSPPTPAPTDDDDFDISGFPAETDMFDRRRPVIPEPELDLLEINLAEGRAQEAAPAPPPPARIEPTPIVVEDSFEVFQPTVANKPPVAKLRRAPVEDPEDGFTVLRRPGEAPVHVVHGATDDDLANYPDEDVPADDQGSLENRPRARSERPTRGQWESVYRSCATVRVSLGLLLASLIAMAVSGFITLLAGLVGGSGGLAFLAIAGVIYFVAGVLGLIHFFVAIVGFAFGLGAPQRAGARGLAIITMILAIAFVAGTASGMFAGVLLPHGWMATLVVWPLSGLFGFAEWICYLFFLRAVAQAMGKARLEEEVMNTFKLLGAVAVFQAICYTLLRTIPPLLVSAGVETGAVATAFDGSVIVVGVLGLAMFGMVMMAVYRYFLCTGVMRDAVADRT